MIKRNESDVGDEVCIKMKHFEVMRKWRKKLEIEIYRKVTCFP